MPKLKKEKKVSKKKGVVIQTPKGMRDILPDEQTLWAKARETAKKTAEIYSFLRIDTPLLEAVELFERGVGENTDIVEKEMFVLKTKGGGKLVLRPEGTAPVVRAYFENGLSRLGQPLKLYYEGPMFRHEQPQAGRYRQHHQIGFEILGGDADPIYDAQTIIVIFRLLKDLKIKSVFFKLNSIGCHGCRKNFIRKLVDYYKKHDKEICRDCQRRLISNPMRLLDCKNEKCQPIKTHAPVTLDFLCEPCKKHFKEVLEYLDELGIPYIIDNNLVRGLDYYNRTVFEIFHEKSNAALGGGGRYDYLAETLGFGKLTAVGGSIGIERVIELIKTSTGYVFSKPQSKLFLVHIGDAAKKKGLILLEKFREAGLKINESFGRESLKSQLRIADKEQAEITLILGEREVFEDSVILRDMKTGGQETISINKVIEEVKKRLR